ncbi:serine/threonine-protein kinase [Nocardiopsis trehalosi]|uniref:serine/threonine-protein kinase n=1 Tax=Nocardiopsis trehalosi TaxID=109329 RepID=UPI0008368BB9|nr:serine/threonine-protein kinase [Nocardiopsis trehalosi]
MTDPLRSGDPARIGPYTLHARLGGGGMGVVYLGRSPGGHTVAVKVVRPELAEDADFRRRFATEVAAARRVGGFYTAQLVDADPDGDPPWLATAYIAGPSLHRAVADHGPLPPGSVAVLGAGLAEGLAAVHACGIVHRDLKPGNVLLTADGPRLIDFGIARALDATAVTRTATVLGTVAFMSPEQARGERVGPASDVFSLGCVLAHAATGRSPFGDGPVHAVAYRIVHEAPDLSGLPAGLAGVVGACLAKDPAARPGLDRLVGDLAALAPPPPAPGGGGWLPEGVAASVVAHEAPPPPAAGPAGIPGATREPDAQEPDAGKPDPRTPAPQAPFAPAPVAQTPDDTPVPDARAVGTRSADPATARKAGHGTAIAAIVLSLLCVPGLLAILATGAVSVDDTGAPAGLILANMAVSAVTAAALATGAWRLRRRRLVGRRTIVVAGVVAALQGLTVSAQYLLTGGGPEAGFVPVLVFGVGPVTAAYGIAAVITAAHPATGRWCRSRVPGAA